MQRLNGRRSAEPSIHLRASEGAEKMAPRFKRKGMKNPEYQSATIKREIRSKL